MASVVTEVVNSFLYVNCVVFFLQFDKDKDVKRGDISLYEPAAPAPKPQGKL